MELHAQLNLAKSIKNLRQVHRYTQTHVADSLHMCRSAYAQLEAGKRVPNIGVILDLATLYNVSPEMIIDANNTKILDLIDYTEISKVQLVKLVDIYQQLSPYTRGCLMERAEILLNTDAT